MTMSRRTISITTFSARRWSTRWSGRVEIGSLGHRGELFLCHHGGAIDPYPQTTRVASVSCADCSHTCARPQAHPVPQSLRFNDQADPSYPAAAPLGAALSQNLEVETSRRISVLSNSTSKRHGVIAHLRSGEKRYWLRPGFKDLQRCPDLQPP